MPVARPPKPYPLTAATVLASVGSGIFCLDLGSLGKTFRLHAARPGPAINMRAHRLVDGGVEWRADLPSGSAHVVAPVAEAPAALLRVDMMGPLEQRAGFHDPCGGYSDGHDALADRLCDAFAQGDVLFVGDTPGGAAAGIGQGVERVLKTKAQYGRRATGFADEMVASAGLWWMLAVCDEVFVPAAGYIGSCGARGEHLDVSGMMAKEGLKKTYFADPPEKVCMAPEFPLSEEGSRRGNRDVTIAADAFRAAICASPVGQRFGLTPEALIALGADMLTGEAAVGVFADGVETFGAVVAYALSLAESVGAKEIESEARAVSAAGAARVRASARGPRRAA